MVAVACSSKRIDSHRVQNGLLSLFKSGLGLGLVERPLRVFMWEAH